MKKLLNPKNLPLIVTFAGLIGFVIRMLSMGKGVDEAGLYPPATAAWIALWVLTTAVAVLIIFMTKPLSENVKYNQNFPASPVSAVGTLLGAVAICLAGWNSFTDSLDALGLLTGILGMGGGILLVMAAYARLKGMKVNFLYHIVSCLFLALRTFILSKEWSNVPQIGPFLFTFLFHVCAMLAIYQLCAFDVDLGKRRASLFWSLMTAYLCLVALPSSEDVLFCGCIAIWMLTNLCSLRPVKKRKPAAPRDSEPTAQAQMSSSDVSIDEIKSWLEEDN